MNLKEYLQRLNQFVKSNPSALTKTVIYATDGEGNNFEKVHYDATLGEFADSDFDNASKNPNAVCIN